MTTQRGATSGASIHTDPARARAVIEASRQEFDTRYPDQKLSPVVALICAYEEEGNIGPVLAAIPAELTGHVSLVGDERAVRARLAEYARAGVDEVALVPGSSDADPAGVATLTALAP